MSFLTMNPHQQFVSFVKNAVNLKLQNNDKYIVNIITDFLLDPKLMNAKKCEECCKVFIQNEDSKSSMIYCEKCINENDIVDCNNSDDCDMSIKRKSKVRYVKCELCNNSFCSECGNTETIYIAHQEFVCKRCIRILIWNIQFVKRHNKRKKYIKLDLKTLKIK